jgi:hypothetical protein
MLLYGHGNLKPHGHLLFAHLAAADSAIASARSPERAPLATLTHAVEDAAVDQWNWAPKVMN